MVYRPQVDNRSGTPITSSLNILVTRLSLACFEQPVGICNALLISPQAVAGELVLAGNISAEPRLSGNSFEHVLHNVKLLRLQWSIHRPSVYKVWKTFARTINLDKRVPSLRLKLGYRRL